LLATQIDQFKLKKTPRQIAVTISVGHSYFGVYALGRAWVASKFSPTWFFYKPFTSWDRCKLPKSTKMKKTAVLIAFFALLSSCSKNSISPPPTTSLEITLKDELGNPVLGGIVKLYGSENDYLNETGQIQGSKTSNSSGVVLFDNLSSIKYYFSANKDCLTNAFGGVATASALTANNKNSTTCILTKSGTLKITKNSSSLYDIYINGVLEIQNMAGGTTTSFKAGVGTYNIRVLQKTGFILIPTDKTYSGTITCGSTLTCIFP